MDIDFQTVISLTPRNPGGHVAADETAWSLVEGSRQGPPLENPEISCVAIVFIFWKPDQTTDQT